METKPREKYEALVVGAGIAGLTAALYLSRQNVRTLVISLDLGGQLVLAPEIQNYPGFKSIDGFSLAKKVEEQARAFGAEIKFDEAVGIYEEDGGFVIRTSTGGEYWGEVLILAFGKKPKELGVPGEAEFKGRGVSYCATCDAPLFKGKKVVLVGFGHSGVEAASMLSDVAETVYWVFPSRAPGGEEGVARSVASRPNVVLMPESRILEIRGDSRVREVVVETPEGVKTIGADGVFVEIGYEPKTDIAARLVKLNEKGEIKVDKLCRTSKEGVFAAGDVTDIPYKQAVISAGMGAIAALSAYAYLMKKRGKKVSVIGDWKHFKVDEREKGPSGLFLAPP